MRHLEDLPNTLNFEFIGIDHDGNELDCIVKLNPVGCYGAYTKDGDPCFFKLSGWRPISTIKRDYCGTVQVSNVELCHT